MTFEQVLDEALAMLHRRGRVTYQTLYFQFDLDDQRLEALKDALLFAHCEITDEDNRGLVWTGNTPGPAQNSQLETNRENRFQALVLGVIGLLQREKRVPYRTLKYVFGLDEEVLTEVCENLRFRQLARDEDNKGLVWAVRPSTPVSPIAGVGPSQPDAIESMGSLSAGTPSSPPLAISPPPEVNGPTASPAGSLPEISPDAPITGPASTRHVPEAEHRQLTVMFCDLVGSTDLSSKLDPEDFREVVQAYQETAAQVIHQYDGHIAQYLGDGLLIYFGWPQAHEHDAERAVYTGLDIPQAMTILNTRLEVDYGVQLLVRIGIHTGPVVVGEMGGGGRHEHLALGETPNIAARLESLARPNTAVISPVTAQLVQRSFALEELGLHELKGVAESMMLYTVIGPREVDHDDHKSMRSGGFERLVGRDEEIGLLLRRWEQSKAGLGQVVLLSGEPGIGKSSLVEGLRAYVYQEEVTRIAFRCSPYHTNSALYPIIDQVQRALEWQPDDPEETQLAKLERGLEETSLALEEVVPLLASLLSLPLPEGRYPALSLSAPQQRQQTQDVLVAWLLETAERQPVLAVWEDLHWSDPSTLEVLGLFVDQAPTAPMIHVLTFRPEFEPPWPTRAHFTPITLNRLEQPQVQALLTRLADGKRLPAEVVEHIVAKTDGVPLYVEEFTRMLFASDLLQEEAEQYVLTGPLLGIPIPDTLQDSLMARLDQMQTAKEVAQVGAVLGREFSYEMLQAIWPQDDRTLQSGLAHLVASELLYQRGRLPRANYIFKHALIQDTAYASLLRSMRQHIHQQIAELLASQFPETVATHPEVIAHHYTAADCSELAIDAWHQAGRRALERSENQEAVAHLTQGLSLLPALAETPARLQHEFTLQAMLGPAFMATQGYASTEAEQAFRRALEVGRQVASPVQLYPVLRGLWAFYLMQADYQRSQELEQELYPIAEQTHDPVLLGDAHFTLADTLFYLGDLRAAHTRFEQGMGLYDPDHHAAQVALYGQNTSVFCVGQLSWTLVLLGYPEQAVEQSRQALTLGHDLSHPYTLAGTLLYVSGMHQFCRDFGATQAQAEATITLCNEQGFAFWRSLALVLHGWALAEQGQAQQGIAQIREGIDSWGETGSKAHLSHLLALLAEAYAKAEQTELGLATVAEALDFIDRSNERFYEAELYRLKGQFMRSPTIGDQAQAEACFHQALDSARYHNAKFLELRAATSLAKLWQSQDKRQDAHELLAPVYNWFTEGFDTADLQDARVLLDELVR